MDRKTHAQNSLFILMFAEVLTIIVAFIQSFDFIFMQAVMEFPLPAGVLPCNFQNSEGLGYEAEEIRQCIKAGKLQSDRMPLEHTQIVAEIMDTVMKQLGVVYFQ